MHAFTYHCPTEIVFGKDTQLQLAEQIRKYGGSRALLVYGSGSIERSGLLSQLCELLSENQIPMSSLAVSVPTRPWSTPEKA